METLRAAIVLFLCATAGMAQTATLAGHVTDESGAAVPAAKIVLNGPNALARTVSSNGEGAYIIAGSPTGDYVVTASAPALSTVQPVKVRLGAGIRNLDLPLKIVAAATQVTVQANAATVSTEASNNASATILSGNDLQALSDDPQDLQADLEALAGPAAGPGGNTIFVDGFTGGELPAKESIREVRLNSNPFSPEFDKLGLGRIEIFTKPGTDQYHATVTYNLGTDWWNSRNPFAAQKAPFLLQETENSASGPITKRSSFTLDFERQVVFNGSVTNAVLLDPATSAATPFTSVFKTPQRHWRVGPHIDYQLNDKNYLSLRYTMTLANIQDAGIGNFNLTSRGYNLQNTFNTVQAIETSVHGSSVNETRFQYFRWGTGSTAESAGPQIMVLGAFNGGAAAAAHDRYIQTFYELQNNTSIVHGAHVWRFGMRLREALEDSLATDNFNGTFTFGGALAPALDANNQAIPGQFVQISSIEQFRRTQLGLPGGGASQFTIDAGTPEISVRQFDGGFFAGDDWRLRQNLTLNLGFRLETQTNIRDRADYAPRIGFAWAPGTQSKPGKTVLRGGFGIFYDRFGLFNTLTAQRFNGAVQQQYVITDPAFFPNVPTIASLGASPSIQSVQEIDSRVRAPYLLQSAFTVERQLPRNNTLAITYTNAHGLHVLRSEDINAPLPGTYSGAGTGVYPYPGRGPIFLMTTSGRYNQNQLAFNLNSKFNPAVSLTASYVLSKAMSNSDGLGTFPANPYDYSGEYGPAANDIRHRAVLAGSVNTRWNIRFSPNITYQSGAPFNITRGSDPYGTTLFLARPGIDADPSKPGLIQTAYGLLDPNPVSGEKLLGRNAGRGPMLFTVNLRVARTWSFGPERAGDAGKSAAGVFSNPAARRYNLSLGMSGRNLLNHTNVGPIDGNITSPLFGRANQIAGSPNNEGFLETAGNRRLELQLRFTF